MATELEIRYFESREDWRKWLAGNFDTAPGVWFVFPCKSSGEKSVLYNDAVEEALCFEWIDSTVKSLDKAHKIQRFSPRNPMAVGEWNDPPRVREEDTGRLIRTFRLSRRYNRQLRGDETVWKNYRQFPETYKRIRIAYVEAARMRPEEFGKRLNHFIAKTRENRMITGFGGIEKYYSK